ncbi:malectin-like carbohydrate-binding domain-containing protein [Artemisia annua]|uniref:Malectin-like carbohydrate-binding domain-containing protein n=1 Tax=Artemisia annua TaxID=35608 RepID=A0A2U1L7G0_ARTAN|nr:malectin-like carbohydrate-binding domain-containing protein [Artemisia annua]
MNLVIANINCGGSPVDYYSMTWTPDDALISNGIARVVLPSYSVNPVLDTLRVFTSRKKNCYSIGPKLQGVKVLVRATFYYGNYDQLLNPPTFDLHFDGNFWTTVETNADKIVRYETTYVAKGDLVSVCVAQTKPRQFPFLSALEVRKFDPEVYDVVEKNRALNLIGRINFGANQNLRYPSDRYDRIWRNLSVPKIVTNNEFVDTSHTANNLPSEIFQTAIESTDDTLSFYSVSPLDPPIYLNMYFSEAMKLNSTLKRSFTVYGTSTLRSSPLSFSISPPYGSAINQSLYNYKVNTLTVISLNETLDSVLPPLISALELFNISNVLTDGTDRNDGRNLASFNLSGSLPDISSMDALEIIDFHNNSLKGTIPSFLGTMPNLQQFVTGNPSLCTPDKSCSSSPADNTPDTQKKQQSMLRLIVFISILVFLGSVLVTVLAWNLASFNLSGSLPDISSMDALEIIDFHNNSLKGTIPSFLGTMPNLQQFVTGNPSLCTPDKSCSSSPADNTPDTQKKKKSMLRLILFIAIPVFLGSVLVSFLAWYFLCKRKTRPNGNPPVVQGNIHHGPIVNPVPRTDEQIVNGYAVPKGGEPAPLTHVRPDNY